MEKARLLEYGQMGEGLQNRECRAEGSPNLGPSSLEPRAVTSEEVTASLFPPGLYWPLDKAGQPWLTLTA